MPNRCFYERERERERHPLIRPQKKKRRPLKKARWPLSIPQKESAWLRRARPPQLPSPTRQVQPGRCGAGQQHADHDARPSISIKFQLRRGYTRYTRQTVGARNEHSALGDCDSLLRMRFRRTMHHEEQRPSLFFPRSFPRALPVGAQPASRGRSEGAVSD